MLPDGIRKASTRNVRSTRKIATAIAMDLIHSSVLEVRDGVPPRATI